MENLKMKRNKDKKNLTFQSGDLNPRFSVIFPPMIFMRSEEPEIKSKQASKRDRTLPWDEFAVISHCKMPRTDSHHVVKRKLDNETALRVHL